MADSLRIAALLAASSQGWRGALRRLRSGAWRLAEGTAAATLAWVIAVEVLHHEAPFFAPAAALIAMGVTRGQRIRRATEVVVGVALGVLMADVLARALAPRLTLTILLITGLSLTVATLLDGSPILSVQAAVSGIYVAVVAPPTGGLIPSRFVDALVGGGVALAVNQLPLPRSLPDRLLRGAAPVFDHIAEVLEEAAAALAAHDADAAQQALAHARTLDTIVSAFDQLAAAEAESARFDPVRRRRRRLLRTYELAARQLDLAARNVRVLARAGLFLTRGSRPAPASLARGVVLLAGAVRDLGGVLADQMLLDEAGGAEKLPADGPDRRAAVRGPVARTGLAAVSAAAAALDETHDVPVVMIVGQVRATAIDLMLGSGMDLQEVLTAADEALGEHNSVES